MATIRVRNLGPFSKDVRPGGNFGDLLAEVEVGGEIDVVEALAGREPGEWVTAAGKVDDGRDYRLAVEDSKRCACGATADEGAASVGEHWESRDHGTGLLAQVDGWERAPEVVEPAAPKAKPSATDTKEG